MDSTAKINTLQTLDCQLDRYYIVYGEPDWMRELPSDGSFEHVIKRSILLRLTPWATVQNRSKVVDHNGIVLKEATSTTHKPQFPAVESRVCILADSVVSYFATPAETLCFLSVEADGRPCQLTVKRQMIAIDDGDDYRYHCLSLKAYSGGKI